MTRWTVLLLVSMGGCGGVPVEPERAALSAAPLDTNQAAATFDCWCGEVATMPRLPAECTGDLSVALAGWCANWIINARKAACDDVCGDFLAPVADPEPAVELTTAT